jgi:hypothetical protein
MLIYDLLNIEPTELKVHLAADNGRENPLDLYFDGLFKEWQAEQNKRNFQRPYILSLIRLERDDLWLFAGVYQSLEIDNSIKEHIHYTTELTDRYAELIGRLVIQYKRKGRNSYPNGESLIDSASVYEIKPEPLAFSEFKNFKEVQLSRQQLELLFHHEYPSWKSALSSVSGVYLISDMSSGQLYVGSAYGEEGIWSRWLDYSKNYHGGNFELKRLFKTGGPEVFSKFNYSILETCDIDLPADFVITIENRWKDKLLTRQYGLNKN